MKWRIEPAKTKIERVNNRPTWYVYRDDDREWTAVVWRFINKEFSLRFRKQVSERDLKYVEVFCSKLRAANETKGILMSVTEDDGED